MAAKKALVEVYSTRNGSIFQDNQSLRFVLEWKGIQTILKLPCFFGLKRRIDAVDIVQMLDNPSASYDVEIIVPCGCERCFVLTAPEIIEMKSLFEGTRVMMELNSIIYERLHRPVLCL